MFRLLLAVCILCEAFAMGDLLRKRLTWRDEEGTSRDDKLIYKAIIRDNVQDVNKFISSCH